jgi:protein gp37
VAGPSDIEWTDATWNPIAGCTMISPGCTNCYAMRMAARLQSMGLQSYAGTTRKSGGRPVWTGSVNYVSEALDKPLMWRKPRKIFVNSMSDLFQDDIAEPFLVRVWQTMLTADHHVYQVLTKRPDNMLERIQKLGLRVPRHIWLGVSVENAAYLKRIEILRKIPRAVRFVSFEPLLGPVGKPNLAGIHWAIVGGESGPRSRPIEADWVDSIKTQCRKHKTAFFFKQWGGSNKKASGRIYRGRTWDEYPAAFAVSVDQ